ncbi:hypothetical protein DFR29_102451 [Tahibacter aquaticus]|uniref:Lipoprotein n=1 Tax=Tahibacter aquaticus TaxID=520092 RepID=A0A4R6Z854_9GAMM|nr:hypothetical protein [Tahibacter aquaticus]TDR47789.1 hypothetical protein DFR29_102451 [Tahibacter aquaticus]
MKRIVRLLAAAATCLLMTACVSAPKRQAFNAEVSGNPKTLQVLPLRHSQIDLFIVNNPGYNFGLIGLAIAEGNRKPKAEWLRSQVRQREFDHLAVFRSALEQAMAERGYTLQFSEPMAEAESAKTRREAWGTRKQYVTAAASADAQLDINFGFIGYAAAGSSDSAPYRPSVVLTARLVSADGKRVLFEDQIVYNSVFPLVQNAVTLNPDERFRYPDFDDLKAAGPVVVEGLDIAFRAVATELARQL